MNLQTNFINESDLDISDEIIVFGAGCYGKQTIYLLKLLRKNIIACFDNDVNVTDTNLMNITKCLIPCWIKDVPIVISIRDEFAIKQVCQQCRELGYSRIYTVNHKRLEEYIYDLPDKEFLELQYAIQYKGAVLNWIAPKTFNEKQQWMKLYDRNPLYTKLVDKLLVKNYVAEKIGSQYIIPTIGVWDNAENINFNMLPERFVLKCTHDSGSCILCLSKETSNISDMKRKISAALKINYFYIHREWPYKNVKPQVICEEFIGDENGKIPYDFKVSCFNGKPEFYSVAVDRQTELSFYYYDINHKDITDSVEREKKKRKEITLPSKKKLDEMIKLAKILSCNFPYVRVDFMISEKIYFTELTFFPDAGVGTDWNDEWLEKTGEMICLREDNK